MNDVHAALRALLTDRGGFDPAEVELLFEPPVKERINALFRPAVCFFLVDMQENTDLRQTYRQTVRGADDAVRRMPPRRFDLRYLVSAFATETADEHTLLWRTLVTLLQHATLPAELLPDALRIADVPVAARVLGEGDNAIRALDYWNALGLPPRPAIAYAVTVPVELDFALRLPLVLTRTLRTRGDAGTDRHHVGGTVRDADGAPVPGVRIEPENRVLAAPITTDAQGRFVLVNLPTGAVSVRLYREADSGDAPPQTATLTIPSERYEITWRAAD